MTAEDALGDAVMLIVSDEIARARLPMKLDTNALSTLTDLTLRHVEKVGAHDARQVLREFLTVEEK